MKRISLSLVLGITLAAVSSIALAARNSAGTYSLPPGNPVVPGYITRDWANSTLGDISSEITASLSRDGYGAMRSSLRLVDGTLGAPGVAFTNQANSGLYRIGLSDVALSVNATKVQEWTPAGTTVPGTLGVTGNTTVGGTLGVTGQVTTSAGISAATGTDLILSVPASQLWAVNQGGTTRLEIDGTGKIWANGSTLYGLPTPVTANEAATKGYVDTRFIVAGRITGGTSTMAQTGSVTATVARTNVGIYTVTVPGLTAGAIVLTSAVGSTAGSATVASVSSGSFVAWGIVSGASSDAVDVAFTVLKL